MRLDYECRIPGYHGDDDWVGVADALGTDDAVRTFARRMDAKDFELFLREDDPRDVWVRKVGNTRHMVYRVWFHTVKEFHCNVMSLAQ